MKRTIVLLVGLTLFLLCNSCWHLSMNPVSRTSMGTLLERKGYFIPDSLFAFFPSDTGLITKSDLLGVSYNARKEMHRNEDFNPYFIMELYKLQDTIIARKLLNQYEQNAISVVDAQDSTYNIITYGTTCYYYLKKFLSDLYNAEPKDIILPYFQKDIFDWDAKIENTLCGLAPGTKIVTVMQGNDIVFPKSYVREYESLPISIRHGYRSGVAISVDSCWALFWTMVW